MKTTIMKQIKKVINNGKELLIINYGLHYINGNNDAYFSITGEIWNYNGTGKIGKDCITCGCIHDEILKHFPNMKDMVELHLSDSDGTPTHAIENGFYHFKQNNKTGFNYIRLPENKQNISISDKSDFITLVESLKLMYKKQAQAVIDKYDLK